GAARAGNQQRRDRGRRRMRPRLAPRSLWRGPAPPPPGRGGTPAPGGGAPAVRMAPPAATTPGRGCTPARAAGTPARSAAAAPTGHDARSAAFCSDPRAFPDRSAAKKILEFKPSTAVERARGIQSRKAYCNYMRMSGGPKGPPFLLTSEQPQTVIPANAGTHTPQQFLLEKTRQLRPYKTTSAGGDGSLRSQGRRKGFRIRFSNSP